MELKHEKGPRMDWEDRSCGFKCWFWRAYVVNKEKWGGGGRLFKMMHKSLV